MKFDPDKSPVYVVLFAAVVSGAFTAVIMALHVATEPVVVANQRLLTEKALVELFGLGDPAKLPDREIAELVRRRIAGYRAEGDDPAKDLRRARVALTDPDTGREIELLVAFREDLPADAAPDIRDRGRVLGYAFPISGVGFWARIDGLLAVDARCEKVLGVVFLQHSETPGLGGRITEKEFREQFRPRTADDGAPLYLTLSPPPEGMKCIYVDKDKPARGSPRFHRHVDAITGATGTSSAVERFLDADIRAFLRAARAAGLAAAPEKRMAG